MKKCGTVRHKPFMFGVLLLFGAMLSFPLCAQQPAGAGGAPSQTPQEQNQSTGPETPKTKLADLAWLAGRWQGAWGPRVAQQIWTAPQAGVMLGTFQLTEGDKTLVLELFTLVEEADGIKLYIRHFTPSLVAWEKTGPTTLRLKSADAKSIVFVNAVDGQPKESVMTRVDPDTYTSRSEIVPEKGDPQVSEITYHRAVDGGTSKHKEKKTKSSK